MAEEKRSFTFPSNQTATAPAEYRVANALEHMAHYLERIDGHLERLVRPQDKK